MKSDDKSYDLAITGGGLAGLCLAIQAVRLGQRVCLFEKETYPFHKVCGEYISMESWDFLVELGLPLDKWNLPKISQLHLTSPGGKSILTELPLGGFGISRFKLDASLASLARQSGVDLFDNCKVQDIIYENGMHKVQSSAGEFRASVSCVCYGKKSNLDVKWKRHFVRESGSENYVGVKYHVRANLPPNQIGLHNFSGGYCGISEIEDNQFCLCYLTRSRNLKNNQQSIPALEDNVLRQNPVLKKILEESEIIFDDPVTIAQITYSKKTQIENHNLCIGDAAGMITPLCGNGMSMAMHASKLACPLIRDFLNGSISRTDMERQYQQTWTLHFSKRLRTGRFIQHFFGNPIRAGFLIRLLKPFPSLVQLLIRSTHGVKF